MHYYLGHKIEHINKKHTYQFDDEGNCISESLEITSSKMVQDEKTLKVIYSEIPIELGEELTEYENEFNNYNDFYWEERWIIIQELHPNFWRM